VPAQRKRRRATASCGPSSNWSGKRDSNSRPQPWQGCALPTELFPLGMHADHRWSTAADFGRRLENGAGNETRTRDLNLGKVALYQLSYSRMFLLLPGGATRSRTGLDGFAIRCITALLSRLRALRAGVHPGPPRQKREAGASLDAIWSGKRDSNSRPQPWQGCALPTELFPHGS
jgi:hypothetical protein